MHSWRALILEFVDRDLFQLYDFSEPWDGPNNRKLAYRMPRPYSCPSDPDAATDGFTSYVVVVGHGAVFSPGQSASMQEVSDPANTILLVETAGTNIPWLEPKDLSLDDAALSVNDWSRPTIASRDSLGAGVCLVDGRKLRWEILPQNVREMFMVRKPNSK